MGGLTICGLIRGLIVIFGWGIWRICGSLGLGGLIMCGLGLNFGLGNLLNILNIILPLHCFFRK